MATQETYNKNRPTNDNIIITGMDMREDEKGRIQAIATPKISSRAEEVTIIKAYPGGHPDKQPKEVDTNKVIDNIISELENEL